MELTVKKLLERELSAICKKVTDKYRKQQAEEIAGSKFSKDEIAKLESLLRKCGWSVAQLPNMMELFSSLMKAPELAIGSMLKTEPLCCLVVEDGIGNRHNHPIGVAHIVTDTAPHMMHIDGCTGNWTITTPDKPRYATDEEIDGMVSCLTSSQWHVVHTQDLFKPVMEAAFGRIVSIKEEPVETTEDNSEDVELPDGRKITVSRD